MSIFMLEYDNWLKDMGDGFYGTPCTFLPASLVVLYKTC